VKDGLLAITSKLFDIRYRPAADAPTWHPDVEAIEVTDASGKLLGRFYFDLYPRDGKYKHAAVFSIRDTTTMEDGSRLMPIAAIECNFPKPGGAAPALMSHSDAVTFFHEFGHVIHHLLSESELSTFAGTSVARDFVESPSQMLEEWAWQKDTLALFARHHDTNAALPGPLHAAMLRSAPRKPRRERNPSGSMVCSCAHTSLAQKRTLRRRGRDLRRAVWSGLPPDALILTNRARTSTKIHTDFLKSAGRGV
jgi:thimet oligopeptidase